MINEIAKRDGTIHALRHELAERDKLLEQREATILKQQARITSLSNYLSAMGYELNTDDAACLEAALKAERIKTLEDVAPCFDYIPWMNLLTVGDKLRRMANELKEQSCQ